MDALDIDKWRIVRDSLGTSFAVSSILIALLMLGRAAFVFPLSFLPNLAKKNQSEKINFKMQLYVASWHGPLKQCITAGDSLMTPSSPSWDLSLEAVALAPLSLALQLRETLLVSVESERKMWKKKNKHKLL